MACRLSWHKIQAQLLNISLAVTLENDPVAVKGVTVQAFKNYQQQRVEGRTGPTKTIKLTS